MLHFRWMYANDSESWSRRPHLGWILESVYSPGPLVLLAETNKNPRFENRWNLSDMKACLQEQPIKLYTGELTSYQPSLELCDQKLGNLVWTTVAQIQGSIILQRFLLVEGAPVQRRRRKPPLYAHEKNPGMWHALSRELYAVMQQSPQKSPVS